MATDRPREHGGVTLGHELHKQHQGAAGGGEYVALKGAN